MIWQKVIPVGDERFLFGKAMICKRASDDFYLPLTGDEIHDVPRIFEMLTVTLCADGKDFQAFRIEGGNDNEETARLYHCPVGQQRL